MANAGGLSSANNTHDIQNFNDHTGDGALRRVDDYAPAPASIPQGGPNPSSPEDSTTKEKRHRNKPSLSCEICTVKKTKCDRVRPECFACQKRRTECRYSHLADLIEDSHRAADGDSPRKRQKGKTSTVEPGSHPVPQPLDQQYGNSPIAATSPLPAATTLSAVFHEGSGLNDRTPSRSSAGSAPSNLLSNVPFSHPTVSNIFKVEHPFSNYWTHRGGLAEVIRVLPSKDQSDILIARYFEVVDPVYPFIDRDQFLRDYDELWLMQGSDEVYHHGSLVALLFVMLAMGTQFATIASLDQKEQTAEFYISASNQALRVINYLALPTIRKLQTMVLINYFLMNDNHASDAWAFAGILTRHASALGLNRDPSRSAPHTSFPEKQQRRKLWQAILFQDTFFSLILQLPPNCPQSDCRVEDLAREVDPSFAHDGADDIAYISGMWRFANLVQPTICSPRALNLPVSDSEISRSNLIRSFEDIYFSLPSPLRTFSEAAICELASQSKRIARQALFLSSNYYHCLMLIYSDQPEDLDRTLEAAHEAISSFFLLHKLFEDEARVWYHFQHRAFSEALTIAELVKSRGDSITMDPKWMRAKDDVIRMIGILSMMSELDIVARTRVSVLSKYL